MKFDINYEKLVLVSSESPIGNKVLGLSESYPTTTKIDPVVKTLLFFSTKSVLKPLGVFHK